jgi:hypothetical protein
MCSPESPVRANQSRISAPPHSPAPTFTACHQGTSRSHSTTRPRSSWPPGASTPGRQLSPHRSQLPEVQAASGHRTSALDQIPDHPLPGVDPAWETAPFTATARMPLSQLGTKKGGSVTAVHRRGPHRGFVTALLALIAHGIGARVFGLSAKYLSSPLPRRYVGASKCFHQSQRRLRLEAPRSASIPLQPCTATAGRLQSRVEGRCLRLARPQRTPLASDGGLDCEG